MIIGSSVFVSFDFISQIGSTVFQLTKDTLTQQYNITCLSMSIWIK